MLRDIFEINPHPRNPHVGDIPRIAQSIMTFGYRNALRVWKDYVIAGSHTLKALRYLHERGETPKGVLVIDKGKWLTPCIDCSDMTEDEAMAYMLADNQLPTLGANDLEGILEIVRGLDDDLVEAAGFDTDDLTSMLDGGLEDDDTDDDTGLDDDDADEDDDASVDYVADPDYTPNILYPGHDNAWDIPTLDMDMQADGFPVPIMKWGSQARSRIMEGTYHFYVEDYKFEALWKHPNGVVNSRVKVIIEPNFSTSSHMPRAEVLYMVIYRKRWLARYWQSQGIRVVVDVNIERSFFDIALMGVPKGWKYYANRAYTSDTSHLYEAYKLCVEHAGIPDIVYTVYGGGRGVRELCRKEGWNYLAEEADVSRKRASGEMESDANGMER